MKERIGFIGLGIMGKPMSKNLMKAGFPLVVYDLNPAPVEELVGLGAEKAASARDLATKVKTIIIMLPNGPDVMDLFTGSQGILDYLNEGTVIMDMSSISPSVSMELHSLCKAKNSIYIDAPVSGGEPKAIDASLAIMVGCDEEYFHESKEILRFMGSSVVRIGNTGSGNVAKLANQIIVALNIAAISEAYVLAMKAQVDPNIVFEAIKGGLAGSTVMNAKSPMIFNRNFNPGFKIKLHIKDLSNALEAAHNLGVSLPLTASVMEMMQSLKSSGCQEEDHSCLIKVFEKLSNTIVKS
jgi:2-hydroxy-3-oxopropionate reductase